MLLASLAGTASAQEMVHRCTDAGGQVSYQSAACPPAQRASAMRMPAWRPAASAPATPRWTGFQAARTASIVFHYDPADEPVGWSAGQMEAAIQDSLAAWMTGCKVALSYGGRRPRQLPGAPEHVPIYWEPKYMNAAHPSGQGFGIGGTGSLRTGVALRPHFREEHMRRLLVHEIGHVLGLPHNHADPQSVMSYLQDERLRVRGQPSPADYSDCNQSMKRLFGIDHPPVAGEPAPSRPRMTDREALDQIRRNQQAADEASRRRR